MFNRQDYMREYKRKQRATWRAQGIKENTREMRLEKQKKLTQILGNKCSHCGWEPTTDIEYAAMDFHHIDPATKSFNVASNYLRAWDKLVAEVHKCILLCARCHRIEEVKIQNPKRGRPRIIPEG